MTDQGELRDRVERQLCMFFDENYDGHLYDASQAIIDEFGLTVETVGGFVSVAGNHDARRVVGKWERCD